MPHISQEQANQWFEETKIADPALDETLEASTWELVTSALGERYDVAGWVDVTSTPPLVRTLHSMLYASWLYRRTYSDQPGTSEYADKLESSAMALLGGLAEGSNVLEGVPEIRAAHDYPVFFPTDIATRAAERDPLDPAGAPRAFSMTRRF